MEAIQSRLELGVFTIKETASQMPDTPGIYMMLSEAGDILYIGKAKRLKRRVISYSRADALPLRLQRMIAQIHRIHYTKTQTETEALLLECNLINKHKPRYNILLKDDKSYPYIHITDHDFPKAIKHRGAKSKRGEYFGPYANVEALDEALLNIQKIFQLRNCADHVFNQRKRPCLQFHIKRCSGPCVGLVSNQSYSESVEQARQFLKGQATYVHDYYKQRMEKASLALEYEDAARYRDQIKMMRHIQSKQLINVAGMNNSDVIVFHEKNGIQAIQVVFFRHDRHFGTETVILNHSSGDGASCCLSAFIKQFYFHRDPPESIILSHIPDDFHIIKKMLCDRYKKKILWTIPKMGYRSDIIAQAKINAEITLDKQFSKSENMTKILKELARIMNLEILPQRIEVYDNAHIQGKFPVGCMIVATPEGFDKKSYRKFNHHEGIAQGGDDYAMMRHMLERRLKHDTDWIKPDLIILDGGVGQVSVVQKMMDMYQKHIPLMGISKGIDRHAGKEYIILPGHEPFQIDFNSPLLYFLQRIRDEAHRYANTTHRQKRNKNISQSHIDDVPGVGPQRKKALLQHFGSVKSIKQASIKELILVKGMSRALAESIYHYFREQNE